MRSNRSCSPSTTRSGGTSFRPRYLAYLGERVSDLPVLIVLTVRTGEPQDVPLKALTLGPGSKRLELQALSAEAGAGAELTRGVLGADAAPQFSPPAIPLPREPVHHHRAARPVRLPP